MPTLLSNAAEIVKSPFDKQGKPARHADLTSGQHEPLFDEIAAFENFPHTVSGPTLWVREDYQNSPMKWQYRFTPEDIRDISRAADEFISKGRQLRDISKAEFQLGPHLTDLLARTREDLINGKGFCLFKGHPTTRDWDVTKVATAYMGLGSHIGAFLSQNGKGHVLGHVKDLGNDPTQIDKVRIYSTNAKQFFHVDDADVIGLLCLHRALEGGESDIVSSHHVFNVLRKERPDVLKTLATPNWYFDRKGEVSVGEKPYIRCSILYYYKEKLTLKWDPYFVRSLKRFWDSGEVPPLSPEQLDALQVLEDTAVRESLHMVLEVGDIQFVSGNYVLHARTAYTDHPAPHPRRQLMRLWLATSEAEGGWPLPFHDSKAHRRGGIQVDDQPHTSPLDAE